MDASLAWSDTMGQHAQSIAWYSTFVTHHIDLI